jgi:hypothetical protein
LVIPDVISFLSVWVLLFGFMLNVIIILAHPPVFASVVAVILDLRPIIPIARFLPQF